MIYFKPDFMQFFKELAANNNRDWFHANKERYEEVVKKPMEIFVTDVIKAVSKYDKTLAIEPKDAIFRINRDVRFAKDKSPYKLNTSAVVTRQGRKGVSDPGIYFELGPENLRLAGGAYSPDKEHLLAIREAIAKNPKAFMKLLEAPSFKKVWGELQGERNKVLPAEFKKAAEVCPYLYNKQLYYWLELDPKIILSDKLLNVVMEHYKAAIPVAKFLGDAYQS